MRIYVIWLYYLLLRIYLIEYNYILHFMYFWMFKCFRNFYSLVMLRTYYDPLIELQKPVGLISVVPKVMSKIAFQWVWTSVVSIVKYKGINRDRDTMHRLYCTLMWVWLSTMLMQHIAKTKRVTYPIEVSRENTIVYCFSPKNVIYILHFVKQKDNW